MTIVMEQDVEVSYERELLDRTYSGRWDFFKQYWKDCNELEGGGSKKGLLKIMRGVLVPITLMGVFLLLKKVDGGYRLRG